MRVDTSIDDIIEITVVDVKVLDHIIMAPNGKYFSFADQGLL